jgi:hypothetical protein
LIKKAYTDPHWSLSSTFSISSKVASIPTTPMVLKREKTKEYYSFTNNSDSSLKSIQIIKCKKKTKHAWLGYLWKHGTGSPT